MTLLEIEDLAIPEVKVLTPKRFGDDRGYFSETYNQRRFNELVQPLEFVQDNESYSAEQYTVRGLHYQAPPHAQGKLVRVLSGSILDVAIDVRKGSPTFGKHVGATLSAHNGRQILVPAGFLHGFITLEPETLVSYKVTDFYHQPSEGSVHWYSAALGIDWGIPESAGKLSQKDADAPDFEDFDSPFTL